MSKASSKTLEDLHSALADVLTKALKTPEGGEAPSAPVMSVARQFLKDNGVEALPVPGSSLGNLVQALPEFDDEETSDDLPTVN